MNQLSNHAFRYLAGTVLFTLSVGTFFYHIVEKLSWVDAYYFSVVTLATVGYGDITPHTTAGKLFTSFYILTGVGIITTFFSAIIRRRAVQIQKRQSTRK